MDEQMRPFPATREEWEAWVSQQNKWDIYFRDDRWGSVELVADRIVVRGPKAEAIQNLLESMRRGQSDTALFRSLPHRLTGHVFTAFPEDSAW